MKPSRAGAAAAAVMSSSKTVLRPATGASTGPGQPTVQHIIHQTIQVLIISIYPKMRIRCFDHV